MNKRENTVSYDGKEWFLYITRNVSLWGDCLALKGNYFHLKDFGIPVRFSLLVVAFNAVQNHYFAFEPNYTSASSAVLNSCLGVKRMIVLEKKYKTFGLEFLNSLERCLKETTVSNWQAFLNQYERYAAGLNLTAVLGRVGAEALKLKLGALDVPEQKIPEVISKITYPEKHTPLFLSQHKLYVIASKIQGGEMQKKDLNKELKIWLSRHGHIPVNFSGEPWTIKDAKTQFMEVQKKNAKKELEQMAKDHDDRVLRAKETLSAFKDEELNDLAETIARATYLNEYRKDIFSRVSLGFRPIFRKVARLGGSKNWRDCFYLLPEEMTALLEGKKIPIAVYIKKRTLTALRVNDNTHKIELLDSKDAKQFASHIKNIRGDSKGVVKEATFKGYSANKGKVAGHAKIILGREDFHKLKSGDILVAMATSVDYVPIMERAAAFITNEGGITSHASIVSREMNKPCIIGTKIATKVLKDGDFVEVDANRGIVEIIKRA